MQDHDPLLTLLGRRGRCAIVRRLRDGAAPRSVRALAHDAGISHTVARRAVKDLVAVGAVEWTRTGRDGNVRWLGSSPAGAWLSGLQTPDLIGDVVAMFAQEFSDASARLSHWYDAQDTPGDPQDPIRIAVLWLDDEDRALDATEPALDAVAAAQLPLPDVTTWAWEDIEAEAGEGDLVAKAILNGVLSQRGR